MMHHLQFEINQLQSANTQRLLESILVVLLALFTSALLPQLLIRYVYAGQQLLEQPQALELIPTVSFVVAIAFGVYALGGNIRRSLRIRTLQRQLQASALPDAPGMDHQVTAAAEQAVSESRSSKPRKKRGRPKKRSSGQS